MSVMDNFIMKASLPHDSKAPKFCRLLASCPYPCSDGLQMVLRDNCHIARHGSERGRRGGSRETLTTVQDG
eukprot:scaffold137349_cov40-Prasinocladus_malaysianus.AAC.3